MHGNETFPHNSKRTLTWQLHRSCLYVCVMRKGKPKLILKKNSNKCETRNGNNVKESSTLHIQENMKKLKRFRSAKHLSIAHHSNTKEENDGSHASLGSFFQIHLQ